MLPIATINHRHLCKLHVNGRLNQGSLSVEIEGRACARVADRLVCDGSSSADLLVTGSSSVEVNGLPVARLGDFTHHGGFLVEGCASVGAGGDSIRIHFSLKSDSVRLTDRIKAMLVRVAQDFYEATGKELLVTGGDRTAAEQAEEMYKKLESGARWDYTSSAGSEVRSVYNTSKSSRDSRADTLMKMSSKIQNQMDGGTYVSRHLTGDGADIRTNDLSSAERRALERVVAGSGLSQLYEEEGRPNEHLHVAIPGRP